MKTRILIVILALSSTFAFGQIKVLPDGKVGMGTTSPNTQLHLDYTNGPQITLSAPSGGGGNTAIVFRPYQIPAYWTNPAQAMISATDNNWSADIRFWTKIPGALGNNLQERMTILNTGKVGIGTSSPNNLLQVLGLINFNDTYYNTFLGSSSGASNSTGASNTFIGYQSGFSNTTGIYNTFSGRNAGGLNVSGHQNAFLGYYAGYKTTGSYNTAIGSWAGYNNTTGYANTYFGQQAGWYTNTGYNNTFIGTHSGWYNTSGVNNTFLGTSTGLTNTTGVGNSLLGYGADVNGAAFSNATAIGYNAVVTASNYVRIGNTSVTAIGGQVGWTTYSDGRFKMNVSENVKGLEFINKLRPVTYNLNTQACDAFIRQNIPLATDSSGNAISEFPIDYSASMSVVHSGFIAQEVDSVAQLCGFSSSIVNTPANSTDPYALTYAEFVVPLVKAVQELNAIITTQEQQIQSLETQIDEQNEQIQQLESTINNCCISNETKNTGNINSNMEKVNTSNSKSILHQNTPNPFNKKTTIRYSVPENSGASSILVFDMQGKLIKTYPIITKGEGSIEINANELQPGMYMYSLISGGKEVDTKKMILTE